MRKRRRVSGATIAAIVGGVLIAACAMGAVGFVLRHRASRQVAAIPPTAKTVPDPPEAPGVVQVGDVSVGFAIVSLDNTAGLDIIGHAALSADVNLNVLMDLKNANPARKIDFVGWSRSPDGVRLTDELGNSYRVIGFPASFQVLHATSAATLYADQSVKDLLVFERPVPAAKMLILELPAANFGGTGSVRFKIVTATLTTLAETVKRMERRGRGR